MRLPKMIGAHVPKKPSTRARRCPLAETAQLINRAYDERFVRAKWRMHLVYQPRLETPQT